MSRLPKGGDDLTFLVGVFPRASIMVVNVVHSMLNIFVLLIRKNMSLPAQNNNWRVT